MRNTISSNLATVMVILFAIAERWLELPGWVLIFPLGLLALDLLGFFYALYQRRKELIQLPDAGPAKRTPKGFPWGRLWLLAFTAMMLSPLLAGGGWIVLLISLLIGLPVLAIAPFVIGLCLALHERQEEKKKGELEDAKNTNGKGFAGAVVITILTTGLMFLLTGAMLVSCFGLGELNEPFAAGVILFCAFVYLAIAVGVVIALWQRWHEIQGGEEDEAKKY